MHSKMRGCEESRPTLIRQRLQIDPPWAGSSKTKIKHAEESDMKTIVGFTVAALATLVLATAADADAQDRQCQW
jgi:hypothetical protein